jgi:RNA polymerase sigma-70 factor (ECF subfamily)
MATWPADDAGAGSSRPPSEVPGELGVLWRSAADGDEVAFSALYDATVASVYGLAVLLLRSPVLAARVAEASYLEIWRTAAGLEASRCSPLTTILAVVHAQAVHHLRAIYDVVDGPMATSPSSTRGRDRFDGMPLEEREALDLAYFSGRTRHEIAALTAVPVVVVDARLRDGLLRLRSGVADR